MKILLAHSHSYRQTESVCTVCRYLLSKYYITLDVAKVNMQDPVSEVNLHKGIVVIVGVHRSR